MKHALSALGDIGDRLRWASRVMIATDFDGTLCPITNSPSEAILPADTSAVLGSAAQSMACVLAVISGRSLADIQSRVPPLCFTSGNHGLEIAGAGISYVHPAALSLRPQMAAASERLRDAIRIYEGAWVEEKGLSATLHFRNVEERYHRQIRTTTIVCSTDFAASIELRAGRKAIELRPRVGWDKGAALSYIRKLAGPFDLCICLGDDLTDEAMFQANPGGVNIKVGGLRPTSAGFFLCDTGETAEFLSHIVKLFAARYHPRRDCAPA